MGDQNTLFTGFRISKHLQQNLITEIWDRFHVTHFSVVFLSCLVNETKWLLEKLPCSSWVWPSGLCSSRVWRSALFMYCMFWHGTRGLRQNNNINQQKEKGFKQNIRLPTNIYTTDTGTCISLVGKTQHCKSNALTELLCPLLYSQGSLGNWYVYLYFFCFFEFVHVTGTF